MEDTFIREHIEGMTFLNSIHFYSLEFKLINIGFVYKDLLRNVRTQVLIKLIKPYTKIHIPFIAKELNIDATEVENLLVACILDK